MKILIIRFSSFGDVLLTTPVIRKIKGKYPDSEIDFIVYESFSEAISLNPYIRKLILFDRKKSKDRKYINEMIKNLTYMVEIRNRKKEQGQKIYK